MTFRLMTYNILNGGAGRECGKEWLTNRELRVVLIGPTQIVADEQLTEEELRELQRRLQASDE